MAGGGGGGGGGAGLRPPASVGPSYSMKQKEKDTINECNTSGRNGKEGKTKQNSEIRRRTGSPRTKELKAVE